jgi:RecA-family ATPase
MSTRDRIRRLVEEKRTELQDLEADLASLEDVGEKLPAAEPLADFVSECLLMNDDDQWLIRSQIPRGGMGFLAADPGLGKTTLLVQISLLLAAGRPVFGYHTEQSRTLLIAAEGARRSLSSRVLRAAGTLGIPTSTPTWFIHGRGVTNFFLHGGQFAQMLEASRPALVILDTLKHFWEGDENSADSFTRLVSSPLKEFGAKYGCTFWLVHHHRKTALGEEDGPHQGRGTSIMFADADFWWRLVKEKGGADGARILHCDKNKYGQPFAPMNLTFNGEQAILEIR